MAVFATGCHAAGVPLGIDENGLRGMGFFPHARLFSRKLVFTRFDNAPYSYCVDPGMG